MGERHDWQAFVRSKLSVGGLEEKRERDVIAEVASQLEDLYQDALSKGATEADARRMAEDHVPDWEAFSQDLRKADRSRRRARGDQWAEASSESLRERGGRWCGLADLIQDVRYAFRGLKRKPGFTAVALLTLALGVGGATTIFTFYDQVLVRPLPYPDSGELVEIWEKMASFENATVSYANYLDWRERNQVFEDIAVWNNTKMHLTGSGDPQEVLVGRVSASVFPILRADLLQGRGFLPEEDRLGASPAVVLSHAFWQDKFGEAPDILGRVLTLDGYPAEVVGILSEDFQFPPGLRGVDLYAPVELFAEGWIENRGNHPGLMGLARLRSGVSMERAREDMERVALELEAEFFDTNEGSRVHVAPLQERVTRNTRDPILLLLLAVTFLLLIACINVANLVLAKATGRQQEMAVRGSLGAAHFRILRLLITETLVLWIIGGLLGLAFARGGVGAVARLFAEELPPVFQVSLDLRVVGVTLGVTLLTGLIFGLVPAMRVIRQDPQEFLKEGRRTTGGTRRAWFRNALVVAEVSLAVALLVGAGLALRTFSRVVHTDPGLDPSNVLTAEIKLPEIRYPEESERTALYTGLLDRVRSLPGVISAASMYVIPVGPGGWQNSFHVEGDPPEEGGAANFAEVSSVSTDYFRTMGIPFLQGRDFTRLDNPEAPRVVIVGQAMAERFWPGEDPVGKRLKWGGFDSENPWIEVVGVVGHVKVNGVVREAMPQLYIPHWQDNDESYYLGVRTRGDPLDLIEPIRRTVLAMDPSLPLATVQTLDFYVQESIRGERLLALLMAVLSASALLLAAIGIYGVMAQMTAERRHEIGIRMALGARGDQVLGLVFRQGFTLVTMGLVLGLGLAVGVGKAMASQLFQVAPTDPLTFTLTSVIVVAVAVAANLLPARRATRVNPVRALQTD